MNQRRWKINLTQLINYDYKNRKMGFGKLRNDRREDENMKKIWKREMSG